MIKIISDSTCDLSKELIERYDISILPLHVTMGEQEYMDGIDITPQEIFAWSDANKTTPKTSAISVADAMDLFSKYTADGNEIIAFSISDHMSTTGNVMRMAVEELGAEKQIHVIDSASLSTGVGLLVIKAAVMAQQGRSAEDIVAKIEEVKTRVRAGFVVDTLTYLHRGGRCSGVEAFAGGMLKLHPRIDVVCGKMEVKKKYRGRIDSVIKSYVKELELELSTAERDRVFITHAGCDDQIVAWVRNFLEDFQHFEEILETHTGSVISSHCGPGTLGVLFIAEE